jgi:uncharacterized membrane protein
MAVLALVGAGIAGYLTYVHYRGIAPICTTGGCEKVQSSTYADLLGIPVAVIGLGGYLALLATTFSRSFEAAAAAAAMAVGGLGFALYLLYVQLALIDAVCIWCVGSDAVMTLIAVVAFVRLRALDREPEDALVRER